MGVLATAIWPVYWPANAVSSYRMSKFRTLVHGIMHSLWPLLFSLPSQLRSFISFDVSSFASVISFRLALQKRFVKPHENRQFSRVLGRIRTRFAPNASNIIIFHFIFRCTTKKSLQVKVSQQLRHRRPATICELM